MVFHAQDVRQSGIRLVSGAGDRHRFVMRVIEPLWTTKPETATRLRGRIESFWIGRVYMDIGTGENPARWKGHLDHLASGAE